MVSPHQASRVYFGSQRIWRSDDRGDRWTAISPDLTLGQERYAQRFYGRTWSVDALHDNAALPAGHIGLGSGYVMANVDSIGLTGKGTGGHGA